MKYCGKCGELLDQKTEFCGNCGEEVKERRAMAQQNKVKINLSILKKKKILLPIIGVVVLVIVGIFLMGELKKTVNVNDYINIKIEGYNTGGVASINFDKNGFARAILKVQGKSQIDGDIKKLLSEYETLFNSSNFTYSLDKSSKLSNGDKVKLNIICNKIIEDTLNIKIIYKDKEYTASDLKAPKEIDPFQTLEITYVGKSPFAEVSIKNNATEEYLKSLSFNSINTSNGIKKGDTFTVKLGVDPENALRNGYIFTTLSKEYTCDKVDAYLTDISSLSTTNYDKLQTSAKSVIEKYFSGVNTLKYSNMKFVGSYLLISNSMSNYNNKMYIVYSADVTSSSISGSYTIFIPVLINSVVLSATEQLTGSVSDLTELMSDSITDGKGGLMFVKGYLNGTNMYNKLILANKNRYTYQIDGEISQFGK